MEPRVEKTNGYHPRNKTHLFLRGFFIFGFIFTIIILISNQPLRSEVKSLRTSLSLCPAVDTVTTDFQEDKRFQTFNSTADKLWQDTVTPNGGFVIDESRTGSQVNGIAMFHQLHCLAMVRSGFQALFARNERRSNGHTHMPHDFDEAHILHCLDYFRQVGFLSRVYQSQNANVAQSFLCYADGAIEPTKPSIDGGCPTTNGMVPHVCKDPLVLYQKSLASHWSEEHLKAAKLQSRASRKNVKKD
ncbi:hypothetical protein GLAREA_07692 [Glarea lozoyensis ATCC 20868]|uniref:Oxidase ustYa n=1 Tax=Glarea lozoyensis (strain ATCC 20868 / MF5171) TaxID=1116229 RepID=S3E259_GLAL2|nr:uncharacterized protein GLAREA_07692 [Glarea lozoyensis ATCC 20868]EPE32558.1 hypothetical protein GLAREA_07692 [Glarea lozoyensis ATCC 20868]